MSYPNALANTEIPLFVELYDFISYSEALYLTSYYRPITYGNRTYTPATMERTQIERAQGEARTLTISFAVKENASLKFLNYNIPQIRVVLRRYFPSQNLAAVLFVGEVKAVGVQGNVVTVSVEDILAVKKLKVPRFFYANYCNHTLFDAGCGLLKEQWRVQAQVEEINNRQALKSYIFASYPNGYFTYGYVEYRRHYRLITKHEGGTIYLHAPFDTPITNPVWVYPGCDKTPQTCRNKFNNFQNFLGFPYMPTRNPTIWGV
ncbi:phage BR0599 family protein [Candidatus Bathyarchaeota archaeon]|nr:phage BR0599 family protein [Candidatus Bathyarchaeota archaeon]